VGCKKCAVYFFSYVQKIFHRKCTTDSLPSIFVFYPLYRKVRKDFRKGRKYRRLFFAYFALALRTLR